MWDELEPFNCEQWYTAVSVIINMHTDCTLSPTVAPTPHPSIECSQYDKYVYVESPEFAPFKSETFYGNYISII